MNLEPSLKKYDVFLSFRGPEVRKTFVDHLYESLTDAGLKVYWDERSMEKGECIDKALNRAIEDSGICIVILSRNYASSPWCLQELTHMCDCKAPIKPLFYHVHPHQVRYAHTQSKPPGKQIADGETSESQASAEHERNPYSEALKEHISKGRYPLSEIEQWGKSLKNVSNNHGWTLESTYGYEGRLVRRVVSDVVRELGKLPYQKLPEHHVQLERIEQVISRLNIDNNRKDVLKVGIWGLDGIGKTTIAKAVFNAILQKFDAYCFLSDVSTYCQYRDGLKELKEQQIKDLYSRKNCSFDAPDEIRSEVSAPKRVLLVLDDVVDSQQLEVLAGGDWAGPGSRIIVTTPNKHVLNMAQINNIYEMKEIEYDEALRLFSLHAFSSPKPEARYAQQSDRIVRACGGLPVALEVVGDELRDKKKFPECWNEALSTPESICHQGIYRALRPSYDKLPFQERKILLHIARSYIGKEKEQGIRHWERLNWNPNTAIVNLELKSLIRIDDDSKFMMNSVLIDMAKAISKEEETGSCFSQIFSSISNSHIKSFSCQRSLKKGCRAQSEKRQNFCPGSVGEMIFIEGAERFELHDFHGASPLPLGPSGSVSGTSYKIPLSENRVVVVKELPVDVSTRENFVKATKLSAKLKHRNVAGIEAYHYSPESKFVVQNYFRNGSLHYLLHGM